MNKRIAILLIFFLRSLTLSAQDFGPVGPKANTSASSTSSTSNVPVNLPYKPANSEKTESKKNKKATDSSELVIQEPKKEAVIPHLPPQYPPFTGAPDFGL